MSSIDNQISNLEKQLQDLRLQKQIINNVKKTTEMAIISLTNDNDRKTIYTKFLTSDAQHCLITAPPQVGKTEAIKDYVNVALKLEENIPIIISCDNKTDQLNQMFSRFQGIHALGDVFTLKVNSKLNKQVADVFKKNKKLIIFCLDNPSQIDLVKNSLILANENIKSYKYKKVVIIHDEGDVITKDNFDKNYDDMAITQKKWIELVDYFNQKLDLKRVFVTATPENCTSLYNIKPQFIVQLETPSNYMGYDKVAYTNFEDPNEINNIIRNEILRKTQEKEKGAILVCTDRKIEKGHLKIFDEMKDFHDVIIHTYNGDGILTRIPENIFNEFEKELVIFSDNKKRSEFSWTKRSNRIFRIQNMSIRDFYTICNKVGQLVVITIGMDLIARGISYVSGETENQLCATSMIYKPGTKLHNVAICQAIGRIFGCVRNDITRRLFAPESVICDFQNFVKIQKQYLEAFANEMNMKKNSQEIMSGLVFDDILKRPIDREKLGLKFEYKETTTDVEGEIDGVNLNKLAKWSRDDSLIGRMVQFLYQQKSNISFYEFKNGVNYNDSDKKFADNIDSARSVQSGYGKLWNSSKNNQCISINSNIFNYLKNIDI